jgi:Putative stress-induced transcription regulator
VQSFVNTWDGDNGSDLLLDPADTRDWLTGAGLWNAQRAPDPAELHLARTQQQEHALRPDPETMTQRDPCS